VLQKTSQQKYTSSESLIHSVISHERESLTDLCDGIPSNTPAIVDMVHQCTGRIVFTGMGKSGLTAQLLAATFSSIGIPSLFVHPTEALHGDIGMVQSNDLCVVLSKSGNGIELEAFVCALHAQGNKIQLWSCRRGALVAHAQQHALLPLQKEAGLFDLVPTSSILVLLSYGHAVGLAVAHLRGFSPDKFFQKHPAGSIGKQLRKSLGE